MEINKFILICKNQFDKCNEFQKFHSPRNSETVSNLRKDIQSENNKKLDSLEGIEEKQSISASNSKEFADQSAGTLDLKRESWIKNKENPNPLPSPRIPHISENKVKKKNRDNLQKPIKPPVWIWKKKERIPEKEKNRSEWIKFWNKNIR